MIFLLFLFSICDKNQEPIKAGNISHINTSQNIQEKINLLSNYTDKFSKQELNNSKLENLTQINNTTELNKIKLIPNNLQYSFQNLILL